MKFGGQLHAVTTLPQERTQVSIVYEAVLHLPSGLKALTNFLHDLFCIALQCGLEFRLSSC